MDSKAFKQARIDLGLSYSQLGAILNVEPRTIRKWEQDTPGRLPPNPMAARVLEWMLDGYRPPQWPAELRGGTRRKKDADLE